MILDLRIKGKDFKEIMENISRFLAEEVNENLLVPNTAGSDYFDYDFIDTNSMNPDDLCDAPNVKGNVNVPQ